MAPWRWWDGHQWTPYMWPARATAGVSAASMADARRKEMSLTKWAKLGLASILVSAGGSWGETIGMAHTFRSTLDQITQNIDGQSTVFTQTTSFSAWSYIVPAIALSVAVVFLVWQHSAASVSRGLGYPARLTPGFGVASWFLPVAGIWYPYQALSDILPPDHPMRPLCFRAWVTWLGSGAATVVAFFLALASTAAAFGALTVASLLAVYAFFTGVRLIDAVDQDHTSRLRSGV